MAEPSGAPPIERLTQGNARFLAWVAQNEPRRAEMAAGQQPFAIVLTCADSRVAPEIVFDAGPGELFVVRVAGNIANACSIASIEYAVAHLGTRLIVVMAHESCGAVAAAIEGGDAGPNLNHLIEHIAPAVASAEGADADAVARLSAQRSAERLTTESEILRDAVNKDGLEIVTAFFHFSSGEVELL